MTRDDNAAPASQYLSFLLGDEVFALDIRSVREIIQCGAMTPVPMMPRVVRGVINLRGAVVPVIDLHARFGRPAASVGRKSCIVIFEAQVDDGCAPLGLLVDAVSAVVELPADAIEPPPQFGTRLRGDFLRGVGKLGSRFVMLLDADRALDVDDMARMHDTLPEAVAA